MQRCSYFFLRGLRLSRGVRFAEADGDIGENLFAMPASFFVSFLHLIYNCHTFALSIGPSVGKPVGGVGLCAPKNLIGKDVYEQQVQHPPSFQYPHIKQLLTAESGVL